MKLIRFLVPVGFALLSVWSLTGTPTDQGQFLNIALIVTTSFSFAWALPK